MQHPRSILVFENERCGAVGAWAKLYERNEIGMPQNLNSCRPSPTMLRWGLVSFRC